MIEDSVNHVCFIVELMFLFKLNSALKSDDLIIACTSDEEFQLVRAKFFTSVLVCIYINNNTVKFIINNI